MDACPQPPGSGCLCPSCHPGLLEHARDPEALQRALARLKPARLRVVTMPRDESCDGSMTCSCQPCQTDRVSRVGLGAGRAQFKVRPPRHLRRAA